MRLSGRTSIALLGACLFMAACASTRLVNVWKDARYSGPPFTKILVIGVTRQAGIRRTFEDIFAEQLRARHVEAVPSYTLIPEDGEVSQQRLVQAVGQSGADGVLVTRLVKVNRETQIYPGTYAGPPYMGFYGFYSSAWMGFYDPPQVYTYDVVTSETSLFDAKVDRVVWSGTTETFSPREVRKDTQEFASVIIKALADQGLIPKDSGK